MDNHRITLERLALVALCSLWLSAKIEERESNVPKLNTLNKMIQNQYPLCDFKSLERLILHFFEFEMIIPTAATFCEYFIEGIVDEYDYALKENYVRFNSLAGMKRVVADLAFEYLDLMLSDCNMLQDVPSKMAAACLAAARYSINIGNVWNNHLLQLTKYQYEDIEFAMHRLVQVRLNYLDNYLRNTLNDTPESGYVTGFDDQYDDEDDSLDEEEDDDFSGDDTNN